MTTTIDMTSVTGAHIRIRDARAKLRKDYEVQDNDLKASQTKLEAFMLDHLTKTNADSIRTEAGTFYRQAEVTPSASDWSAFYNWIRENDAFDALERRIKKVFIKDYMEEHEGALPPGVSIFSEYVVRVRRPS